MIHPLQQDNSSSSDNPSSSNSWFISSNNWFIFRPEDSRLVFVCFSEMACPNITRILHETSWPCLDIINRDPTLNLMDPIILTIPQRLYSKCLNINCAVDHCYVLSKSVAMKLCQKVWLSVVAQKYALLRQMRSGTQKGCKTKFSAKPMGGATELSSCPCALGLGG